MSDGHGRSRVVTAVIWVSIVLPLLIGLSIIFAAAIAEMVG